MPVYLAAGSWASMQLGLHELIGAYFAGAIMPPSWVRRLPVEAVGTFALIWFAPMFFGHSGLHINGDALTWPSVVASLSLVVISMVTKIAAVYIYPPAASLKPRQALGVGALLQCKGLMEIVAATILHGQGMLSEFGFCIPYGSGRYFHHTHRSIIQAVCSSSVRICVTGGANSAPHSIVIPLGLGKKSDLSKT